MNITILTDNPNSWFVPYGKVLCEKLQTAGHRVEYVFNSKDIKASDICFLLSCTKLVNESVLALSKNNIVVHASDLPKGKGFSPLQWQIIEGYDEITLTLFEVVKAVDSGPYYLKGKIALNGGELYLELRCLLARKIIELCSEYVQKRDVLVPVQQTGRETFYRRRTESDDEIDINKTIAEQFNHLRIADNENYPAFFYINKKKYYLKIYEDKLK